MYHSTYKGVIIWKEDINSSGIKYTACYNFTANATLKADTLAGIKRLISKYR